MALAAVKGDKTINELANEHGVHPNQVSQWKQQLLEAGASVFDRKRERQQREQQTQETELSTEDGAGVAEKKSCPPPWNRNELGSSLGVRRSVYAGSVSGSD